MGWPSVTRRTLPLRNSGSISGPTRRPPPARYPSGWTRRTTSAIAQFHVHQEHLQRICSGSGRIWRANQSYRVPRSEDITLEGSDFSGFRVGTNFTQSQNVTIRNNSYTEMSGDATKFAAIQGALIEGNRIENFRSNREDNYHQDMIQFFTSGTTALDDIVIRGTSSLGRGGSPGPSDGGRDGLVRCAGRRSSTGFSSSKTT